jgi:SAM-dependent methyltransferase
LRPRIGLARGLIRLGGFVQSLAVAVMRPRDIIESSRLNYGRADVGDIWAHDDLVDRGLDKDEQGLLGQVPIRQGRLLVLFGGGGREAIAFAHAGFDVTSIDFSATLSKKVRAHAVRHRVHIEALTQDSTRLELPAGSFDIAWISSRMYSTIPGKALRIRMLQGIARVLKPEGILVCQFSWDPATAHRLITDVARMAVAVITAGNLQYQRSDHLMGNAEFTHLFSSEAELRDEFTRGGFDVLNTRISSEWSCGGAVLIKAGRGK